jgi:hypothetical protein
VSDTAQLAWFWSGLGVVSGLGRGLTRESADAARAALSGPASGAPKGRDGATRPAP